MSATRRPDESFADFKVRQKAEAHAAKVAPYMGRLLVDSKTHLGLTREGVTKARMRATKYKVQAEINNNLSNTQKRKKGIKV